MRAHRRRSRATPWAALCGAALVSLGGAARVWAAPKLLVDNGQFSADNFVRQLAVSRDDRFLLVSDFSSGVAFYDTRNGSLVNRFVGHSLAGDLSYQPALDRLVTTGDRTVKIWDVGGQRLERTFRQGFHSQFMTGVHLDPSGRYVFAQGIKYARDTGKVVRSLTSGVRFFFDDMYLVSDKMFAGVYRGQTGPTTLHADILRASNDERAGGFDVQLPAPPHSVHFDAKRAELYFGYTDGFIVHAVRSGRQGRVAFSRPRSFANLGLISSSCVTSDGRFLVTVSSQENELVVLEKRDPAQDTFIDNAREVHRERVTSSELVCLATRPQVVASFGRAFPSRGPDPDEDTIALYDVAARRFVWRLSDHLLPVSDVAIDRAGKTLAVRVGKDPHQVELGVIPFGNQQAKLPPGLERFVALAPDSHVYFRFRSGLQREAIPASLRRAWEMRTRWIAVALDGDMRPREISAEAFANDFVHNGRVGIQRLADRALNATSPSGRYRAVSEDYAAIRVFESQNGASRPLFKARDSGVTYVFAFSPDERLLAFGGSGRRVFVHELPSGRVVHKLPATSYVTSLAFSRDGGRLVCGTLKNQLSVFDLKTGKVARTIDGFDGEAHDLAMTGDDRLLISTSGDGGLRFWDLASGRALVTAFFDPELGFAAITPQGYFDKSAQFERLLWNVDGVPAGLDQYYEAFYRPQLVRAAMRGDVDSARPTAATVGAPPRVRLVDPPTRTTERAVVLTVGVSDRGGGVGAVRVYANGTAVSEDNGRGFALDAGANEKLRRFRVLLSAGANRIRVVAFNADGSVQSAPVEAMIEAAYQRNQQVNLRAVVIGIQEFANRDLNLKFPVSDAELVRGALQDASRGLYGTATITKLTRPEETTRQRIESALTELRGMDPNDLFVLYIASHGIVDNGRFYLITSNVGSVSSRALARDALDQEHLASLLMNIPAQKKLIVVDTCNAAALGDALQLAALNRGLTEATAMKVLSRAVGTTVLAASTATQQAIEGYKGHGLFTFLLVEGLRGQADLNKDQFVKTTELADYVDDAVPNLAERVFGHRQFPMVAPNGQAFPIARIPAAAPPP